VVVVEVVADIVAALAAVGTGPVGEEVAGTGTGVLGLPRIAVGEVAVGIAVEEVAAGIAAVEQVVGTAVALVVVGQFVVEHTAVVALAAVGQPVVG
jgi:hypothetical protein